MVASAHLSLNVNQRLRITTLWAGINRYVLSPQSGSGLSRMGFDVSCSTSPPKNPDRIAETTKARKCEPLESKNPAEARSKYL